MDDKDMQPILTVDDILTSYDEVPAPIKNKPKVVMATNWLDETPPIMVDITLKSGCQKDESDNRGLHLNICANNFLVTCRLLAPIGTCDSRKTGSI